MAMTMKDVTVLATDVGFDGMRLRAPGEVFTISLDEKAPTTSKWFRPVKAKEKAKAEEPAPESGGDIA